MYFEHRQTWEDELLDEYLLKELKMEPKAFRRATRKIINYLQNIGSPQLVGIISIQANLHLYATEIILEHLLHHGLLRKGTDDEAMLRGFQESTYLYTVSQDFKFGPRLE